MATELLEVLIPTYCRSEIISKNLPTLLQYATSYNITVTIYDNSPDNYTENIFFNFKEKYPNLRYKKDLNNIGHDKNCMNALSESRADYVWLLGDGYDFSEDPFLKILKCIENIGPTLIFINAAGRVHTSTNENVVYYGAEELYKDIGWHVTLTGACIYRGSVVRYFLLEDGLDYFLRARNFPQILLICRMLGSSGTSVFIPSLNIIPFRKIGYWGRNFIAIFLLDFPNSLEMCCFNRVLVKKIVLEHNEKSGLFRFKNLLALRLIDSSSYKSQYKVLRSNKDFLNIIDYTLMIISGTIPIQLIKAISHINKIRKK